MKRISKTYSNYAAPISVRSPIQTTDESHWVKSGSVISGIKVLAAGTDIRDIQCLMDEFKRPDGTPTQAEDWRKMRGTGIVTDGITDDMVELHWYEAKNVGKVSWKIKRFM